jgi:hypothetical protein
MQTDTLPITAAQSGQDAEAAASVPADKLLVDSVGLARWTSLSLRHLRRLDSSRDIPGRVAVGRRVLFRTEIIIEWVRAGLPNREQWAALQRSGQTPHQQTGRPAGGAR